jgi:hypothetical protein
VLVKPPRDAETLRKNPLGLYVEAIDWSRELDPPIDRPPVAPAPTAQPVPGNLPVESPLDPGVSDIPQPEVEIRR